VFLGLILLTLAIFPLHGLMMAGHTGTEHTVGQARAFGLATSLLELVSGLEYDRITQEAVDGLARSVAGLDDRTYRMVATVGPDRTCPLAGMPGRELSYKRVTVEVTWLKPGEPAPKGASPRVWLAYLKARAK